MEQNDYSLYIPQGLKLKAEIFDGYGKDELFKSIIIVLIAGAIDAVIYMAGKSVSFCIVFILVVIGGAVMALTRDKTSNISIVIQAACMIRFAKSQKKYRYRYSDEW